MGGWRRRFYAMVSGSTNTDNIVKSIIRKMLSPCFQSDGELKMT